MIEKKRIHVPPTLGQLFLELHHTQNQVTKSALRDIISKRLGRIEQETTSKSKGRVH